MTSTRIQHPLLPSDVQAAYQRSGDWADLTLAEVVRDWASRDPDRPAIAGARPLSYVELWESASRLGGTLAAAGLQPGEFVLAPMSNSWQGVVLAVAVSVAGGALNALSSRVSPTLALNLSKQVGARGLVLQADLLEREEWRQAFDALRRQLPDRPVLLQGDAPSGYEFVPTLEAAATTGPPLAEIAADPGRPSLVLSTGGTTGKPKSVVHCDNTMLYAAQKYAEATDYTESDIHVAIGPYGHASGSVFEVYMPLLYGASVLPNPRWRAHSVAEAIAQFGGTYALTVGTHLFDLLALESEADPLLSSMRLVTSGAGANRLFEDVERRFGFKVVRVFGLSECLGHAIGRPGDPPELRLRRDGMPFPGVEFAIVDPESREPVRQGEVGEYLCRSPSMFMGYFGDAELTAAAITEDGFYRTGDLMTEDPPGYLTWSGRTKHVIRRGGLQIDVVELENLLAEHPKVAEVVVVAIPDPRLGERAALVVVPRSPDEKPELAELVEHLGRRGLGKESMPERLAFADALPRTEFGKVRRDDVKGWLT
jgi:acyl-coenzyme A synthetase/AMP-(fatty) acid ligase